jgi:hypothetical protein
MLAAGRKDAAPHGMSQRVTLVGWNRKQVVEMIHLSDLLPVQELRQDDPRGQAAFSKG